MVTILINEKPTGQIYACVRDAEDYLKSLGVWRSSKINGEDTGKWVDPDNGFVYRIALWDNDRDG